MLIRYIIVHKEYGVFLGSMLGLGFWSKLDSAGQDEACTFSSPKEAFEYVSAWCEEPKIKPTTARVMITNDQLESNDVAYATKQQVVDAGFDSWES